ncbi:MAG TPA: PfkB family carbohydrate kinase [Azonexus sp.]|nr:PfkB family carbohydrate kinase [Azonexus sp.]
MSQPVDLAAIRRLCPPGQRLVLVTGIFNILHPGHLRLLRYAAECGECLVVGVLSDRLAPHAYLNEGDRLEAVNAVNWVDTAFLLDAPPEEAILALRPDIVVKGKEHDQQDNPEKHVLDSYGGRLLFGSGDTTFSSLNLLREEARQPAMAGIRVPVDYQNRHRCLREDIVPVMEAMTRLRVAVIGDTIVDEYISCDPLGMSQEDPTIVVTPILTETFIGGAAIVAAHARGLGAQAVHYFSVTGGDEMRSRVEQTLDDYGVTATLVADSSRPTTLKQRFRAGQKTLLRVNHLRQHKITPEIQDTLYDGIAAIAGELDLLIFSDFSYGALPQPLIDRIVELCRSRGIDMAADSQCSSQMGDIGRFRGMTLITPTEREARIALNNFEDGLVILADRLRQETAARHVLITLGAEGTLVYSGPGNPWITDRLSAMNTAPKDVAGAGDSLLVASAMALQCGASIWQAAFVGSVAAACQVSRLGNVPLAASDIINELQARNDAC